MSNEAKQRNMGRHIGWAGYASIIRSIQMEPKTAQSLAQEFGTGVQVMRRILCRMLDLRFIHRSGWVKLNQRGMPVAVWAFGEAQCAPAPNSPCGVPRAPSSRTNRLPELTHVIHMLRMLMNEPISKTALCVAAGSTSTNVCRFVSHCHRIGLIRIADWELRLAGGAPAAQYHMSAGSDQPRPRPEPRALIERRSRMARAERKRMQAMIFATAANRPSYLDAA